MLKPIIAITMGDAAGVGPEIIIRAIANKTLAPNCQPLIIGDTGVVQYYTQLLDVTLPVVTVTHPNEIVANTIPVLDTSHLSQNQWEPGKVSKQAGGAAYDAIIKGIELAKAGTVDAIVTAPINKEALHAAGHSYPGHTEIFAEECNIDNFTMLFRVEGISVVHVTTHCSLRDALKKITTEKVYNNIHLLYDALLSLGIENPRIAVGGVNPHAGENGLFGTEEIEEVNPAIQKAQQEGLNVQGPFPPDTVFMQSFRGDFDGVVAMLHDHGFVALKSRNFEDGVNITIGLPIIRTSVGHGTAFDIAGKGVASTKSLEAAVQSAVKMVEYKKSQISN